MEKSQKHLQNTIMGQNRHQFIWGYDGFLRRQFLKDMVNSYPINIDGSKPIGIYLDCVGLPKVKNHSELDKMVLLMMSREYCYFSIVSCIINETLRQLDKKDIAKRAKELLDMFNRFYLGNSEAKVNNLQELRQLVEDTKNVYYSEYNKYVRSGILNDFVNDMPLVFIDLNNFVEYYKKMINNNSFIGIVVDHQTPIIIKSQQAINQLIGLRINKNISMKVACKPNGWETFVALNGTYIESIHDYGTVEFDNSYKEHIKHIKQMIRR